MCIQQDGIQYHLSAQDAISCDKENYYCNGGYVSFTLNYGMTHGFIREENFPFTGQNTTCPETESSERVAGEQVVLAGYCAAQGPEAIKRQIIEEGPVIAMMNAYTDYLTYHDGVYYPAQGAFKFNGQNILKVIGWGKDASGEYWIVEQAWGEDWGQNGYAKVLGGKQEVGIDMIGIAPITTTMKYSEYQKYLEDYKERQTSDIPRESIPVEEYEERVDM